MKPTELIQNKLKEARKFLDVRLNPDDPELAEQLTLGSDWDNPSAITRAMDMQPAYYARWATLAKNLEKEREKIQLKFDVWKSKKKLSIREYIREKYIKEKGLTEKQAMERVTQALVDDKFNSKYNYSNEYFLKYKEPLDEIEGEIDKVKLIVKAFEMRRDLLVSMSHLVRSMIDHNILSVVKKKKQ